MINGINLQFSLQLFFHNVQSTSEENKSKERDAARPKEHQGYSLHKLHRVTFIYQ